MKRETHMHERGRLSARPGTPQDNLEIGTQRLGLEQARDGLLYVPAGIEEDRPAPLVVMLHGAGGHAQDGLALLRGPADEAGLILLAPDSRRGTWDLLRGGYGPDVEYMDRALAYTFRRCAIDPARIAVGGFSDGASYALSLGLSNATAI
jgi:phospholipase/carboxylesterase